MASVRFTRWIWQHNETREYLTPVFHNEEVVDGVAHGDRYVLEPVELSELAHPYGDITSYEDRFGWAKWIEARKRNGTEVVGTDNAELVEVHLVTTATPASEIDPED